jgi:hypothetical protein
MKRHLAALAVAQLLINTVPASNSGTIGAAGNFDQQTSALFLQPGALVGRSDAAISVSASDQYRTRVPYTPLLHPSGNWSAEIWVKPSFITGSFSCPFSNGHFGEPRSGWLFYMDGSNGWSFRGYRNQGLETAFLLETVGMPPQANQWYHLVGTWESSTGTARLYVNGIQVGYQTGVTSFVPTSADAAVKGDLNIGSRSDGTFLWNGAVDEAAIYPITLSPNHVLSHYQNATSQNPVNSYESLVREKSPLCYWRFNQESFDPSLTPDNANTAPTVIIKSATMRGASGLMDVVFRVNDPDDATVKTRALAFIDGQRSFTKVIKPTTFAEGTESKLGDAIASNTDHTLTWNVAADWNISLGQIKFEILAMDTRGLLPLNWVTIPAANGQPELTISKNAPTDQQTLDALFWQYASGDPGLKVENGILRANATAGTFSGVPLVTGTTVETYGPAWALRSMNLTPADRSDVNRALTLRAKLNETSRWHALRKPYEEIDVLVGINFPIRPGFAKVKAVSTASDIIVLSEDGTIDAWNISAQGGPPAGLRNLTSIASGWKLGVAVRIDGTVTAWGSNSFGQANVPEELNNVISVSSMYYHTLALRSDGTVAAWGYNFGNQSGGPLNVPNDLQDVVAIDTSYSGSIAKKSDGSFVTWGYFPTPSTWSGIASVAVGAQHAAGLRTDGTVTAWGDGAFGATSVPPDLSDVVALDCGSSTTYALKRDGTVVAWGQNLAGQTTIHPDIRGVTAIAAGYEHVILLKKAP